LPAIIASKQHHVLALDLFEQMCNAPAGNESQNRAPCLQTMACSLYKEIADCGSVLVVERARTLAATLAGYFDTQPLLEMLGPQAAWGGQEFVPGQEFVADESYVNENSFDMSGDMTDQMGFFGWGGEYECGWDAGYDWTGNWWDADKTTPTKSKKPVDENSSPNVMQILLQSTATSPDSVSSGEKVARKGKKGASSKSPQKLASVVASVGMAPLEFTVPRSAAELSA